MMISSTRIATRRYTEAHTDDGLLVSFATEPAEVDEIKAMFSRVVHLGIPTSHRVNLSHGGYGRYSRYHITQHKYAGGGPGETGGWSYIEVLEIRNPPDERCRFILHEAGSHLDGGSMFTEWMSLAASTNAYKQTWDRDYTPEKTLPTLIGYIRMVHCGPLT